MIFRIAALGIGALAMYYFDPVSGKRRRALLRDKSTVKHARHRAHGTQQRWSIDPVDIDLS